MVGAGACPHHPESHPLLHNPVATRPRYARPDPIPVAEEGAVVLGATLNVCLMREVLESRAWL